MNLKPLPEAHFTPDRVFIFVPKNREVALGLKPYVQDQRSFSFTMPLLAFFLISLIAAWGLSVFGAVGAWNNYFRLRDELTTTNAQVVDKHTWSNDSGITYYITYAFTHPDRNGELQQYTNEVSVSAGEYERLDIGQAVTVYLVPDDPTISQITPPSIADPLKVSLSILLWAVLIVIVGIMTFIVKHSLSRARRLAQHGQLLRGTLTHIEQIKDSDGDEYVKARYQFQSPLGNMLEGWFPRRYMYMSGDPSLAGYDLPPLGTPVAVWYVDDKTHTLL